MRSAGAISAQRVYFIREYFTVNVALRPGGWHSSRDKTSWKKRDAKKKNVEKIKTERNKISGLFSVFRSFFVLKTTRTSRSSPSKSLYFALNDGVKIVFIRPVYVCVVKNQCFYYFVLFFSDFRILSIVVYGNFVQFWLYINFIFIDHIVMLKNIWYVTFQLWNKGKSSAHIKRKYVHSK